MWTTDQRRLLEAMGYTLWQVPTAAAAQRVSANDSVAEPVSTATANGPDVRKASIRVSLADAEPVVGSGQHKLLMAILEAAGVTQQDVEFVSNAADAALALPLLASLQREASARRALWPALRGMRRLRR